MKKNEKVKRLCSLPLLAVIFCLCCMVMPAGAYAEWRIEAVDAPKLFSNFYSRAIAIEKTTNHPHIAYGKDHLYHAYFDGAQWHYETIDDSSGVGEYASIAIDSNNKVHISYYDGTNLDLKYATDASGEWVNSTIDSVGYVGYYTSIAVDSNNKAHISYYDVTNADLKYATNASPYVLTVTKTGTGSGTVTSSPAGINCGTDCNEDYDYGTVVTLTATPDADSTFAGWSGDADCSDGVVTIDASKTCTATFNIAQYTLTVTKAGTGSGTVTSSPPGIDCGTDCSEIYNHGTSVTLTATANADAIFTGWSGGGCSGTGTCAVTMTADTTVTATFTQCITVTSPNGGESWKAGSTHPITWAYTQACNPGASVKIELLKNWAVNKIIVKSTSIGSNGNGSYSWKIPTNQTPDSDYRVRITSTTNSSYTDTSDGDFTIYK